MTFVGYGGISVRRQGVQGLHVHVGMPGAEECWRCLEAILPWLPVVLALSANSPWFAGELNGMASNRAPVLGELPRAGAPPAFASYAEWEAWVTRLTQLGVLEDYTRVWWDARPHPEAGHARAPRPRPADRRVPFRGVRRPAPGACAPRRLAGDLPGNSRALADRGRADYVQNRWSAARFGPRAKLLHADGTSFVAASELGAELLERVRPHGDAKLLARIDPERCEADLQVDAASAQGRGGRARGTHARLT